MNAYSTNVHWKIHFVEIQLFRKRSQICESINIYFETIQYKIEKRAYLLNHSLSILTNG